MKFQYIKSFLIFISAFYFPFSGFSQQTGNQGYDILVMLYEKTPKKPRRNQAEKDQDKKAASNEASQNVFSKYQNGKVLYFYASDLSQVLDKNASGIFLNKNSERDEEITYDFTHANYIIAEYLKDFPYEGIERIWAYDSDLNPLKMPYPSELEMLYPTKAVLLDVLVRLPDKKRELNVTDEKGRDKVIAERDTNNKDIMESFGRYTQGNVYFFYESESKCLVDSTCEMLFVNKNLERDSSIKFKGRDSRYVIAEFTQYYDEYSQTNGADGLLFYDKKFTVMKNPFPNFVPIYYGLRQRVATVMKWDKKLRKYYK